MDINLFIEELFQAGRKKGFSDMEVYYVSGEEFEVTAFDQSIDSYKLNTNIGLSYRGILEGKMGYAYSERFEEQDIAFLVEKAAQNAAETQPDVEVSLFEGSSEYKKLPNRELIDKPVRNKINDALEMERQAKAFDPRVRSVQYCLISTGKGSRKIVNSKNLNLSDSAGFGVAYLSVVAEQEGQVKSGSKFQIDSDYNKIDISKVVEGAVNEATMKFGAKSIPSGQYKILIRRDAAADLLAAFSSVFSSDAAQKGLSLLKGKEGGKIASELVNIMDDPFCSEANSLVAFDDEGVAAQQKAIIDHGVLKTLLYNRKTATKQGSGAVSTGNGFKPSYKSPVGVSPTNFYIVKGERSFEEAVKSFDKALIITDLNGLHSGANAVSGDFSLAAEGLLVENGEITHAVEQITIADNFYNVLMKVEEVLSDFEFGIPGVSCFGSPSLVISEMSVSGE